MYEYNSALQLLKVYLNTEWALSSGSITNPQSPPTKPTQVYLALYTEYDPLGVGTTTEVSATYEGGRNNYERVMLTANGLGGNKLIVADSNAIVSPAIVGNAAASAAIESNNSSISAMFVPGVSAVGTGAVSPKVGDPARFSTKLPDYGQYVFTCSNPDADPASWQYNGSAVVLANYGISYIGTPVLNDTITVTSGSNGYYVYFSRTSSSTDFTCTGAGAVGTATWTADGQAVDLADYGITFTGSAAVDNVISVTLYSQKYAHVYNPNEYIMFNYTGDSSESYGYGTIKGFGIYNSKTGGDRLFHGPVKTPITIGANVVPIILKNNFNIYSC